MVKPDKPLKIGEVARFLGVSTSMVRVYVKQGRLACSLTPGGQGSLLGTAKDKLDG